MSFTFAIIASLSTMLACYLYRFVYSSVEAGMRLPPLVELSNEEIFHDTRRAYEDALRNNGSIVRVKRKNRMEYIVDDTLASEVLTNDVDYNFERGTLLALNLGFLLHLPRSFIRSLDTLVHDVIIGDIETSVSKVSPVFERRITEFLRCATQPARPIDVTQMVHEAMSEAMLTLILGEEYTSKENIEAVHHIAVEVATLAGIFENLSPWARAFPSTWRALSWLKVMCFSIPYYFIFGIGTRAYHQLLSMSIQGAFVGKGGKNKPSVLFSYAQRYMDPDTGCISILDRLWILGLLLGLIFASVHQTAVVMIWVILEVAKRPELLASLREEVITECDSDGIQRLTYASIRNAERLDSFIREVMRTKGDTLSAVRHTTRDVQLGGYEVPAGSFVIPIATLSHMNEEYHGSDAKEFIPDRWLGRGKPAVMVSPSYYPFGLGRWACPGRVLAVSEIKLAIMLLISHSTPTLVGDYEVVDPLNVTSVAPRGQVLFTSF